MSLVTGAPQASLSDLHTAIQNGLLKRLRITCMALAVAPLVYAGLGYWLSTQPATDSPLPDTVFVILLCIVACIEIGLSFVIPARMLRSFSFQRFAQMGLIQGPEYSSAERAKAVGIAFTQFYIIRAAMIEAVAVQALLILIMVGGKAPANPIYYATLAPMLLVGVALGLMVPDQDRLESVFNDYLAPGR